MNNLAEVQSNISTFIYDEVAPHFDKMNSGALKFNSEAHFAIQQLTKSDFILEVARNNRQSVINAFTNVAAVGISLNPALANAYLVPRAGAIVLDISYRGLCKIATDNGVIKWARAANVYENDGFEYHGPADKPVHIADVRKERGEYCGSYCIAKTSDGDILTDYMSAEEIYDIRNKSTAYTKGRKGKQGPWVDFFGEMAKKAVLKRGCKTWPQSDGKARLDTAIEIVNQHEGIDFNQAPSATSLPDYSGDDLAEFQRCISDNDQLSLKALCWRLGAHGWAGVWRYAKGQIEHGAKGDTESMWSEMVDEGEAAAQNYAESFTEYCESDDDLGAQQLKSELSGNNLNYVLVFCDQQVKKWVLNLSADQTTK